METNAKEVQEEPSPFEAFGLPQFSPTEKEEDLDTKEAQKDLGPFEAFGRPQSSPNEEELDTIAEEEPVAEDLNTASTESRGEAQPFEAFGLPQSSPNEEELDTIAEEPVAESRASQNQGSRPQPLERPLEGTQQQQTPNEERGLDASGMQSTDNQTGSQLQSKGDVGQPRIGAGDGRQARGAEGGDPRGAGGAGHEANERMDTEGRGQAGHSHSHEPAEQPHESLSGSNSSFHVSHNFARLPVLGWAVYAILMDKGRAVMHGQWKASLGFSWSRLDAYIVPSIIQDDTKQLSCAR